MTEEIRSVAIAVTIETNKQTIRGSTRADDLATAEGRLVDLLNEVRESTK